MNGSLSAKTVLIQRCLWWTCGGDAGDRETSREMRHADDVNNGKNCTDARARMFVCGVCVWL